VVSRLLEIKRDVSIYVGIWSILLSMSAGLAMDVRPIIILERTFISFAGSVLLGYFVGTLVEGYIKRACSRRVVQQERENEPQDKASAPVEDAGDSDGIS